MLVLAKKYNIPALEIAILQQMFDLNPFFPYEAALSLAGLLETPGINKSLLLHNIGPALATGLGWVDIGFRAFEGLHDKYPSLTLMAIKSALARGWIREWIDEQGTYHSKPEMPSSDLYFLDMMAALGLNQKTVLNHTAILYELHCQCGESRTHFSRDTNAINGVQTPSHIEQ